MGDTKQQENPTEDFIAQNAFTAQQMWTMLGISWRTWLRMEARGETPPVVRVSRKKFYLRTSAMTWLQSREEQPKSRGRRRSTRKRAAEPAPEETSASTEAKTSAHQPRRSARKDGR